MDYIVQIFPWFESKDVPREDLPSRDSKNNMEWEVRKLLDSLCLSDKNTFTCFGGAVAQSVERATPDEEVPGLIPGVAARSLLVGSVSV